MVFSSFIFLYLFFPLTTLLYYCAPRVAKNGVLLLASILFYGWGAPSLLLPLLGSCVLDYFLSRWLPVQSSQKANRTFILTLAIALNLCVLGYFKYSNFFIAQWNEALLSFGFSPVTWLHVALPIGISFFTFQKISYLVDVYRGDTPVARNVFDYSLYVILFPQLIAGPIVRYLDIAAELTSRKESLPLFISGACRFCIGLGKKVLIADAMGSVADAIFAIPENSLTSSWAWLGIIAYAYQIYFDFSGYSDMAIGLGAIFGFHFKENFNRPYLSQSITEFWRRWHISLTTFIREYLYFPMGGSRGGHVKTYRNLIVVFLLSGLWHGAAWTFVFWGIFHGLFLVFDRICWLKISKKLPQSVNVALTFVVVLFGWVLFRAETLEQAIRFMATMIGLGAATEPTLMPTGLIIDNRAMFVFAVATLLSFAPLIKAEAITLRPSLSAPRTIAYGSISITLLFLATIFLAARGHTPFLYFKF